MTCKGCGLELTNNQIYCPRCGTKNKIPQNIPVPDPNAPRQMQPYQMPGQEPPGQPYGQMPGQAAYGQGSMPNMLPPYPAMPAVKKKSPLLPVFIAVGAVLFIIIAVIAVIVILNKAKDKKYDTYEFYLSDREGSAFDLGSEVYMENGVAFIVDSFSTTDLGDGTKRIDFKVEMGASYENLNLYSDDFIVVPMDENEVMIADAEQIHLISDGEGNPLPIPVLLDTEYFNYYTISFIIPSETRYLTLYGANFDIDKETSKAVSSGPVYYTKFFLQ
jgi:hypothetical protein